MVFAQDVISTDCTWLRNTVWSEVALLMSWNYVQQRKTFNIGLHTTVLEECCETVMTMYASAM